MITIVDYGMGNIRSVEKALAKIGAEHRVGRTPDEIRNSDKLILPGVGNFGEGMKNIADFSLLDAIRGFKGPLLGICLGMQLLFDESEESPGVQGLGLVKGKVVKFRTRMKIPHVGWNEAICKGMSLMKGIEDKANFYFVHSYHAELGEDILHCTTDYDYDFVSAVEKGHIYGTQFHPEKSQIKGLHVLRNFAGC
jgi:imidazole glycerol phosphate synthase glutamine amidotransferase subunit